MVSIPPSEGEEVVSEYKSRALDVNPVTCCCVTAEGSGNCRTLPVAVRDLFPTPKTCTHALHSDQSARVGQLTETLKVTSSKSH